MMGNPPRGVPIGPQPRLAPWDPDRQYEHARNSCATAQTNADLDGCQYYTEQLIENLESCSRNRDAVANRCAKLLPSAREQLAPIIRAVGREKIATIGQDEIDKLARALGRGKSPATINRQVYTPTVAVLHHAARKKWCAKPVIGRPKVAPGRVRWITADEAERLIAAASEHMRPLVVFLLSTGCRLSEALYLQWEDVDLSRAHVSIYGPIDDDNDRAIRTKNGEARGIPLHARAVAELASVPWDRKGAVFRRPAGKIHQAGRIWLPYEHREGGGGQIKTGWAGMCRRAEIANFTPHDCRHTWATWHYAANRDFRALMELGGWKSPEMVFRYAHMNTDHLAASIDKIWSKAR